MMCSWRLLPGLHHEDQLVDAGRLVPAQELAELVGRADRPPQPGLVAGGRLGPQGLAGGRPAAASGE